MTNKHIIALASSALLFGAGNVRAGSLDVYVGYADDLRPSPFFPSPWDGSPNTVFDGFNKAAHPGQDFDAGAIRIDNTGATPFTFNQAVVTFYNGVTFNLWGSHTVNPGEHLVLTQTSSSSENFDTSDVAIFRNTDDPAPNGFQSPVIKLTIDGTLLPDFVDAAHVLDTGGFDLVNSKVGTPNGNHNESLQWRLIGTTGVTDPAGNPTGAVPDAGSTAALLGLSLAGLMTFAKKRV